MALRPGLPWQVGNPVLWPLAPSCHRRAACGGGEQPLGGKLGAPGLPRSQPHPCVLGGGWGRRPGRSTCRKRAGRPPGMINRHLLSPKLHVLSACCFHCQKTFGAICLEVGLLNLIGSDGTPLGWWKGIWWKEAGGEEKSGRRSKLSTFPAVSQYGPSCAHSKPPQASPCSLHTAHW